MPRGQRKSLEEKIQAKQELINALNIRMESEQRELEELFEQKKRKELEAVSDIIEDAGLAPEEVTEVLQQYIESRRANAPFPQIRCSRSLRNISSKSIIPYLNILLILTLFLN